MDWLSSWLAVIIEMKIGVLNFFFEKKSVSNFKDRPVAGQDRATKSKTSRPE